MANISQIKLPNGDVYNFQDSVSGYLVPSDIEGKVDNFHIQIGEQISGDYYSIDKTYADILMTAFVGKDYMTCSDVDLGYPYVGIASINNNTVIAFGISATFNNTAYLDGYVILPNDTAMRIHEATIIPTKTSDLTNDSGFITTETDPTVPSWAKASSKPTYTASEVGALPSSTTYVSTITTTAGAHTAISNKSGAVGFNVPTTAAHVGIKFGYTTSGNNRAVLQDSSGNLYVTQKDDNTTYSAGTGLSLSSGSFSVKTGYTTSGNNRAVQADSNGNLYVVQTDNNTTYSAGTGLSLSSTTFSVKLGYTTSGNNRAVQADTNGNLYVVQKDDNTTYSSKAAASGGTDVSLVTTGEKYTWNSKTSNTGTITSVKTTAGAHSTINITSGAANFNVPTKTSHLTNDSGFITSSALNNYLPLTGGQVTGLTTFGDTVSIDDLNAGQLVVSGSASIANNLQVNTINGVEVGSNPKFTDNNTTYSAGSNITLTGTTFSLTKANVTGALGYTPPTTNTTYSAGTGLSLSSTTFSVKTGYTTSGNNRAVQADSNGNLYVVQKDTDTTVSTLTLAEDTGTSAITLAHSGKYKLTAGTKTLIFTMPASGNTDHRKSFYGTCSTAAGTAAKVISLSTTTGWELVAGTTITVKFSATNTAQNPTFNVNSSGAKSVWYNTAVITTGSLNRAGYATRPQMYVYDGSHWVWMGMSAEDNTTYSIMSASELSTGTATSARTMSAANTKAGLLDLFYPVGSYYETSDTDFDPNTKWGGTWVLEVAGQVHVSAGTGYTVSGALNNTSDGGSKDAIIPYHNHSVGAVTNGITGGEHTHEPSTTSQSFLTLGSSLTNGIGRTNAGSGSGVKSVLTSPDGAVSRIANTNSTTHSHDLPAHNTNYAGTSGNATNANMQPYVVVNRWHRTA